jgi:G:T-mismatch repair DNA endonuclease (very short patch repair protein)
MSQQHDIYYLHCGCVEHDSYYVCCGNVITTSRKMWLEPCAKHKEADRKKKITNGINRLKQLGYKLDISDFNS